MKERELDDKGERYKTPIKKTVYRLCIILIWIKYYIDVIWGKDKERKGKSERTHRNRE